MIEDRLKQRLTGAAIVVALMVLLVPEMFHGRPQGAPAAGGDAAGGPPLRSYTIDLKEGGAPAAGEAASTSATPALAPPTELAPPAPVATTPAGAPPAGGAAAPGAPTTGAPAVVAAPATPGPQPPAPAAARPPTPSTPAAAPQTGAGTEAGPDRYQVQLGLFASRENADRLAARAARLGVRALVSGPDARGLYRVHTATYGSRAGALAMQQKLHDAGLNSALTPPR